jgi:hypothetical protein
MRLGLIQIAHGVPISHTQRCGLARRSHKNVAVKPRNPRTLDQVLKMYFRLGEGSVKDLHFRPRCVKEAHNVLTGATLMRR